MVENPKASVMKGLKNFKLFQYLVKKKKQKKNPFFYLSTNTRLGRTTSQYPSGTRRPNDSF